MAEPYDPATEASLFRNTNPPAARLAAKDELLPAGRKDSYPTALANDTGDSGVKPPSEQMLKIKKTQEQIELVKDQLASNIEAIQERGERLDHLQDKTDHLTIQSLQFRKQATVVRRKMWWKNAKWTICLGILIIVIVAGAVGGVKGHEASEEHKAVSHTTAPSHTATAG
ncbi:synaptobrevin-domain-containing protein [Papiliotrema laurentii]|uniref:Synaptobrevin-domain-containing protein n=1 Tax=Papiliotrema laurentii TaxID=5418 RepID=A0AAD9CW56_PAPLA|nr:synaptobrevin-domain-containing protein [Papiliotrema laurentii]